MQVLRPVHIVPLKQAYPSQREGTLLSSVDTTEYAAWSRPRLQIEDSIQGSEREYVHMTSASKTHIFSPPITLYTWCVSYSTL